ncbi:MAG: hypothetical protein NTZ60_12245 [Campylobacterales bacterium]|nr:hypothetical protein [Campylobacterales bacterium]
MNSSFAIWHEPRVEHVEQKPYIDLHINLWIDEHKKDDIIDFGFMINNPTSISKFYFFIPFEIESGNIELLTELLVEKPKLANLVFNRDVEVTKTPSQIHNVKIKGVDKEFYTIRYNLLKEINKTNLEHGSLLEFNFDAHLNSKPKYIRFRIKEIKENTIVVYKERAVSYLSGVSNTLVHFEINVNEYRKLPSDVNQHAKDLFVDINRIDMFVMTDIKMEYMFSSIEEVESRLLETKEWMEYNSRLENQKDTNILAYQYTKQAKKEKLEDDKEIVKYFQNFTIFNKFNHEKVKSPWIAFFVIFFIGFTGSLLSTINTTAIFIISAIFGGMIMFFMYPYFPFIKNKVYKS